MLFTLVFFPLLVAALGLIVPGNRVRPFLLPLLGTGHLALTITVLALGGGEISDWVALDGLGRLVIVSISVLFFFCSFYALGYLRGDKERSNRIFVACFSGLLGLLSLVVMSHHLGLLWVAIEGSTLISAPLIYFYHNKLSIEATWKYLLVGSVGIALALLGTFFLAYSSLVGGMPASLSFQELVQNAPHLSKPWLRAAFVLLLVGYGTKLGLAPLHSWKPDAYGESPGVVGAVFAGGITSAAFLALVRVYQVCQAAGETEFVSLLLLILGGLSMAVAGMFLIGQKDLKRMLAYSSVEHMGILVLGLGMGKTAFFGTLLHVLNNSLTKGVLFLSTGNIQRAFGSKSTDVVRGALRRLPLSGALFLAGFLAITGSPPFAPFVSEFAILQGALDGGLFFVAGLFLVLLLLVFIGMGATVLKAAQGRAPQGVGDLAYRDTFLTTAPIVGLMVLVLLLGITLPPPVRQLVDDAVQTLGGQ